MSFTNKVISDIKNSSKNEYIRELLDPSITEEDFLDAIKYEDMYFKDEYGGVHEYERLVNCINTGGYKKIRSKALDKLIGIDGDDPKDKKHYSADLVIRINFSMFIYEILIYEFGLMEFGSFNLCRGIDPFGNNSIILTHQFYFQNCPIMKQESFELKQSSIDMFKDVTSLLNSPRYTPKFINRLAEAMTYVSSDYTSIYYFSIDKLCQFRSNNMINHYPHPSYVYSYDDILNEEYMIIK